MNAIKHFAGNRPFPFALVALLVWLLLGAALVAASAAVIGVPMVNDVPQMVGTLGAATILLVIAGKMGWWRAVRFSVGALVGGVLRWKSLWPVIAFHSLSNAA